MNRTVVGVVALAAIAAAGGWYLVGPGGVAPGVDCDTVKADIDQIAASLVPDRKLTVAGIQCSADRLAIAELRLAPAGSGPGKAQSIVLTDLVLDGAVIANMKTFAASAGDRFALAEQALPLTRQATVGKLLVEDDDGRVSFEQLDLASLAARPFVPKPAGDTSTASVDFLAALSFETAALKNMAMGEAGGTAAPAMSNASVAVGGFDGRRIAAIEVTGMTSRDDATKGVSACSRASYKGVSTGSLASFFIMPHRLKMTAGTDQPDPEMFRALLDVMKGVSVDSGVVEDCTMAFVDPSGPGMMNARITRLNVDEQKSFGFARMGFDGFELNGKVEGHAFAVAIAHGSMTNADVTALFEQIASGATIPDLSGLRLEGYELSGLTVAIDDRPKFELGTIAGTSSGYVDGVPGQGGFKLEGLVFPAGILGDTAEDRAPITDLGFDAIRLRAAVDVAFDHQARVFELKQFEIALAEGGTLSLGFRFLDFDLKALKESLTSFQPPLALLGARLEKFAIAYDDRSLFNKLLAFAAKREGGDAEDIRAEGLESLGEAAAAAPGPLSKAVVDKVIAFLSNPASKRLSVQAAPARPPTFAELAASAENPETLAKALGITAEAN